MTDKEDIAVTRFRAYLRVNTVQPDPDYDGAVAFLKQYAKELDFGFNVVEVHPKKPIVIMTWPGTDPSLPSVILNSHIDVVPVFPEFWKYDPFSAHKEENGDIYARGSQDMKCVGIQYVEAIRKLKKDGVKCQRTIHLTWVPDEEIGGILGMKDFVHHEEFKKLNVGFALDEGLANPTDSFTVFYGERSVWWFTVTCPGSPGHGSRFIKETAGEKMKRFINKAFEFRDEQEKKLNDNPDFRLGHVTTINMTSLGGGVQPNVVPAELTAGFDMRVTPADLKGMDAQLEAWCKAAGEGVSLTFRQKGFNDHLTSTDKSDKWWSALSTTCDSLDLKLELEIFPAATDARYIRQIGIPAIGFSPMNNTPILLHDHNEYLNEKIFLRGVDIYCKIIPSLANVLTEKEC